MMHFPLLFQISFLFSKNVQTLWKIFTILPFPETFLHHYHPLKFLMTFFLVIDHKFRIYSSFSLFQYIFPPVSQKLSFPPYFDKCSPCFRQIHLLFTYFTCISFPPTLTMMHLCITQCKYWTPLVCLKIKQPSEVIVHRSQVKDFVPAKHLDNYRCVDFYFRIISCKSRHTLLQNQKSIS